MFWFLKRKKRPHKPTVVNGDLSCPPDFGLVSYNACGFDSSVEPEVDSEVYYDIRVLMFAKRWSSSKTLLFVLFAMFGFVVTASVYPGFNSAVLNGSIGFFHVLLIAPFLLLEVLKVIFIRYKKTNAVTRLSSNGYSYKGSWFVVSEETGHVYSLEYLMSQYTAGPQ